VLRLGLAQSRQTPLLGTPLRSAILDLERLASLMPSDFNEPIEAQEYNRLTAEVYDRMRDFQALLFHTSGSTDGLPQNVADKLRLFAHSGRLMTLDHDDLFADQWRLLMLGQGVIPETKGRLTSMVTKEDAHQTLEPIRQLIVKVLATMPSHQDFIARTCAAPGFKIKSKNAAP